MALLLTYPLAFSRKLVGHFSHSTNASSALKAKQVANGVDRPLNLIQSVPTRWNSQFFMAQRLIKLRLPVFAVLWDTAVTDAKTRQQLDLPDASWKVLEDIVPVLEPFAEATEVLTKEDTPTLSQVFILLYQLISVSLAVSDDDSSTAKQLKNKIKTSLTERFHLSPSGIPLNMSSHAIVATFLDPRYKSLKFLSNDQKDQVVSYVEGLVPEQPAPVSNDAESLSCSIKQEVEPVKKMIFDCLQGDVDLVDLTSNDPGGVHQEIVAYQTEPVRVLDPLQWWKGNENR